MIAPPHKPASFDPGTPPALVAAAALGLVLLGGGLALEPVRGFSALLAAGFVAVAAALGSVALLALFQVSNAGFHVAFKRVLEALSATLPVGAAALLAVLPGAGQVYRWARAGSDSDALIHAKRAYLNLPAFSLRMALFLALWAGFAYLLRRHSRAQDVDGDVRHTRSGVAISALFLLVGGYSISLASIDWLMSTDPHWSSTIFGFTAIGSVLYTGTAATLVAVVALKRRGLLADVNDSHLHDLGKLLFGFATFWAYLWFSQYLLIWYANLPEETAWILTRTRGGWAPLFYGNVIVGWALPFLALLPRAAKRSHGWLAAIALLALFGRGLDTWLLVAPSNLPRFPGLPWIELGAVLCVGASFAIVFLRVLAAAPLSAKNDPYLVESLHHQI